MDTLLTLIIAFGVIATGICAILAASAAGRQGQSCAVGVHRIRPVPRHALAAVPSMTAHAVPLATVGRIATSF